MLTESYFCLHPLSCVEKKKKNTHGTNIITDPRYAGEERLLFKYVHIIATLRLQIRYYIVRVFRASLVCLHENKKKQPRIVAIIVLTT